MKKIYIILLVLACVATSYLFYNKVAFLNVIVEFDELEPLERKMPVYYKGFKIGKSGKIFPDKHYTKTFVKLKISPSNIELPSNVKARIEKNRNIDYINILYPDDVSLKKLTEGTIIKGCISKDIKDLLSDQLNEANVEGIISDTTNLISNTNNTINELGNIFTEVNALIKEIKPDIKRTTLNLAKATENLENLSKNINTSVEKETIKNSLENIEKTTENIKHISKQIDKVTMPIVNSTLCNTNETMKNTKEISCGLKETLKKHFGIGRILFGRPISK